MPLPVVGVSGGGDSFGTSVEQLAAQRGRRWDACRRKCIERLQLVRVGRERLRGRERAAKGSPWRTATSSSAAATTRRKRHVVLRLGVRDLLVLLRDLGGLRTAWRARAASMRSSTAERSTVGAAAASRGADFASLTAVASLSDCARRLAMSPRRVPRISPCRRDARSPQDRPPARACFAFASSPATRVLRSSTAAALTCGAGGVCSAASPASSRPRSRARRPPRRKTAR